MNVYAYYNYRKYLQDYYDYRKSVQRYFSYRSFAKKAGYSSSGFYLDLVRGRKSLTPQMLPKFIAALGLNEKEGRYFTLMMRPRRHPSRRSSSRCPRSSRVPSSR